MGTIECSQPASKSSWDSQDFGDISTAIKMAHFRKSTGPRWVKDHTFLFVLAVHILRGYFVDNYWQIINPIISLIPFCWTILIVEWFYIVFLCSKWNLIGYCGIRCEKIFSIELKMEKQLLSHCLLCVLSSAPKQVFSGMISNWIAQFFVLLNYLSTASIILVCMYFFEYSL